MKASKQEELVKIVSTARLVENAIVYNKGDVIRRDLVTRDRLVFLLARGTIVPVGGYDSLEEPLFTDVMEAVD